MDIHNNARLTPHSRAELVRRVLADGQTPKAVATGTPGARSGGSGRCALSPSLIERRNGSNRPGRLRGPLDLSPPVHYFTFT